MGNAIIPLKIEQSLYKIVDFIERPFYDFFSGGELCTTDSI